MVKPRHTKELRPRGLGIRSNIYQARLNLKRIRLGMLQAAERRKEDFFWVIGHGVQLTSHFKVPENTYIVFLQSAGLLGLKEWVYHPLFRRLYEDDTVLGKFIHKTLPDAQVPPYSVFTHWENRMYIPGDTCPNMYFELFDADDPDYDRMCGVKRMGAMFRRYHRHSDGRGVRTGLSTIVRQRPGIYFVSACRGTVFQHPKRLINVGYATMGNVHARPASNIADAANRIRQREAKLGRVVKLRVVAKRPARVIKKRPTNKAKKI